MSDDKPRPGWRTGRIPVYVLVPALAVWAGAVLMVASSGTAVGVVAAAVMVVAVVALALEWSTG